MINHRTQARTILRGTVPLFMVAALSLGAFASAQTFSQVGCAPTDRGSCKEVISPPPIYSFTATATHYGQSATLSWQTGFIDSDGTRPDKTNPLGSTMYAGQNSWQRGYCYLSGGEFSSARKHILFASDVGASPVGSWTLGTRVAHPNGSIRTQPIYDATTYTLSCTEVYATAVVSNSATVMVTPTYDTGTAAATLTANPGSVLAGNGSALNWAITKVALCSLLGPSGAPVMPLPSVPPPFAFTGGDQSWNVPVGVVKLYAKLWGAGGAGGIGASGMGGGFTIGKLSTTPGQSLGIVTGGGGTYQGGATYGGGGAAGPYTGAGGGRSALLVNGEDVMMTGGGLGGAFEDTPGGAGGGIHTTTEVVSPSLASFGGGSIRTTIPGSGSGYCGGAGVSDCITVMGTGQTPAGSNDTDYLSGIGVGGNQGSLTRGGSGWFDSWFWSWLWKLFGGGTPGNGGNGYVKFYALDASGSAPTGALTASGTYTLSCTTPDGTVTAAASITVIPLPVLSLTSSIGSVPYGGAATIAWSAENVTSCTIAGPGIASSQSSGSQMTGPLTADATYQLTCQSPAGVQNLSTSVSVGPPPALSLSASPASIAYGGSSTVTWSAQNVDSCSITGPGVSSSQKSGTANTGVLTSGATYTLTCQATSGAQSKQVAIAVSPPPTVSSFSASAAAVNQGQSATLSWSTANVSSCSLSGGIWGSGTSVPVSNGGISTGALTNSTNYTLTCSNSAGVSASASFSIVVNPPPSLSLNASATTIDYGGSSSLSWSSANVSACALAGGIWGSGSVVAVSNSGISTGALTATTTYTLSCQTASYGPQTKTTSVAVGAPPKLSITATPNSISYGGFSTITWSAQHVNSCVVNNDWGQIGSGVSGTQTRGPFEDPPGETFTLVCQSTSGEKTASTTVAVGSHPPVISISANPADIDYNGFSTISWDASYVDSCAVSNDWGPVATGLHGTQNRGPFQDPPGETFTLTCQSAEFGAVSSSTTVHVNPIPQPTLSITATPHSIPYNGFSDIDWFATNVTSCIVSNDWGEVGSGPTGHQSRGPFQDPPGETFTLTCQSPYGEKTSSTTVLVGAAPHQAVSLQASPTQVYLGQSSTLSWATSDVSTCSLSGGTWGAGTSVPNTSAGVSTGEILADTTFTLTCQSPYGYAAASDSVTVTTQSLPDISFSANPISLLSGESSTLTWSCPIPPYTTSQGDINFSTGGAVSGSTMVSPSESTTYHVTCIVSGNTSERASARVTVLQPDLTIAATPPKVKKGKTTSIHWSADNVTAGSCHVTNSVNGTSWDGDSGTETFTVSEQTTFTLTCSSPSGPVSQSVVVNILPVIQNL